MDLAKYSNIKCTLAYRGTRYFGWQKTRMGPSIEESLEEALKKLLQHPVTLQAASRTDRGVHAEQQVINFFARTEKLGNLRNLRAILPEDISLLSLEKTAENFHPTLDCTGKEYHYQICNCPFQSPFHRAFSWHYRSPLDFQQMERATALLVGNHDFSALSNQSPAPGKARRCVTRISLYRSEVERLRIEVEGENFLYKMVRNLVGTLAYVGAGKIPLESLPQILESRDRRLAGVTAPAHGLCLKRVFYVNAQ